MPKDTIREIKFRAWVSYAGVTAYMATQGEPELETLASFAHHYITGDEHVQLMQFTGLLDKNGKEIYDGDLLKLNSGEIVTVYWAEECAMFCVAHKDDDIDTPETPLWEEILMPITQKIVPEVIGNIYENPDLLAPPNTTKELK